MVDIVEKGQDSLEDTTDPRRIRAICRDHFLNQNVYDLHDVFSNYFELRDHWGI